MKTKFADRYIPRWRRYSGFASGAVVGGLVGNVPGALVGGYLGYKSGIASETSLLKNSMPRVNPRYNPYPTPQTGSRKRKLSSGARNGGRAIKKTLFVGKSQRGSYLKAIGGRPLPGGRATLRRNRSGKRNPRLTNGPYTGRAPAGKRIKRTIESKCLSSGYHKTIEQFGVVADSDCVHIMHSTGYVVETCRTMAASILRKLMNKAGYKVTNAHITIPATTTAPLAPVLNPIENSVGLQFVYTKRAAGTGIATNISYLTLPLTSFNGLVEGFNGFSDHFIQFIRGESIDQPYKIAVYTQDSALLGSDWRMAAEIYLEDCKLEIHFQSALTLQNRTKAALNADGTASEQANTDRVDVQPLKGYMYDFKHADPRVRHGGSNVSLVGGTDATPFTNQYFNRIDDRGLGLVLGQEFQPGQEPFVPKYFANVTKSNTVYMQPGELKKFQFGHMMKGKLTNLLKTMKASSWFTAGVNTYFSGLAGKSQMISLEELLRTPSLNKVTIAYERELKIGAIANIQQSNAPLETKIVSAEINRV